jgi:hypothetical protein
VVLLLAATAPNVQLWDRQGVGDTELYRLYGEKVRDGQIPYADFYVEYPPAAIPVFVAPTVLPGDYVTASKALQLALAAASLVLVVAALGSAGARPRKLYGAALLVAVSPVLLGRVTFSRFDFWPAALSALALLLAVRRRHLLASACLAVAIAAKVYPVLVLPLLALDAARDGGRRAAIRALAAAAGTLVLIVAPLAVVGAGGLRHTLLVQLERPLQIESLGGSILLALGQIGAYEPTVVSGHGSDNLEGSLAGALAAATSLVGLVALVAIWLWFRSGSRSKGELLLAAAAAIATYVATGRVLSPQYLIWLIPLVPFARGRRGLAAALLFLVALGLTQVWSQGRYGDVAALEPIVWVVMLRNLVLVAVTALLVSAVAAGRRRTPPYAA